MIESSFCKWFCVEFVDKNKWLFKSSCGYEIEVSKDQKMFKHIYADDGLNSCPNCGKPITVGELIR